MSRGAVLHLIYAFGLFHKGLPALIETQQTVMAAVGQEACFSCQLIQSKDVLQVTWQKLSPDGEEENLATYTKQFGQRVNDAFREKVEFKEAGLQSCSIVIRKVTEEDEGCYRCLFITYPEGALTGTTCLRLYELHEPILHVRESNRTEEALVSCSATARPAPTVTLRVLKQDLHFSNYSSVSVSNTNGTVTVTTTAVLPCFHDNSTEVGCAARVPSGPQIEVFLMIPEVKQSSADGFDEKSGSNNSDVGRTRNIGLYYPTVVLACALIAVFFVVLCKPKPRDRELEMSEMPEATIRDTHKTKESSSTQESDHVRQQTTPVKSQESETPNPSPSTSCRPED